MGGNRNGKNFIVHAKNDGRREFFQHDDRSYSMNNNKNTGNGGKQKYFSRGGYGQQQYQNSSGGGGGGYSGRGNRRGQGSYRGGGSRNFYQDEDVQMDGRANRHQQMYEQSRGPRRGRKPRGRPVLNNTSGWHKLVIKEAGAYPKDEVLDSIKELVGETFIPILLETEGPNLVFYLERNLGVARAIVNLSGRLSLRDYHKIFISSSDTPPPFKKILIPQKEIIKTVMSERYSIEMNRLDLKNFHNDKTLIKEQIFCPLNRPNVSTVIKIIVANCPLVEEIDMSNNQIHTLNDMSELLACTNLKRLFLEKNKLRHMDAMSKLKGLPITELTLDGNLVCDKFKDIDTYTSAVREIFPKIDRLDGSDLPKPIGFEVEDDVALPPSQPSFFCSDSVKEIVCRFIEQYFQVFESDDRKQLEAAYTEDATFSLSANFPENGVQSRYSVMLMRESRNLKKVSNPDKRMNLLRKGRAEVSEALCRFPKCLHDPHSFVIDIPIAQPTLIHVVLTGVFKQIVDKTPPCRSFMKSMIIVPVGSGFCISNEQLYINPATVEQVRRAFKEPSPPDVAAVVPQVASPSVPQSPPQSIAAPVPVQSPSGGLEPVQLELIQQFATHSKMLPEYCKMCLEKNNWDFNMAGEMFLNLQKENKIPPEYYGLTT